MRNVMALLGLGVAPAAGSAYSGQESDLDKYLRPVEISEMEWKLHLIDHRLTEALRDGSVRYRSRARYTFESRIHIDFSVTVRDFAGLPREEQESRLQRVVNLASTLMGDAFPEFSRDRHLYAAFVPDGNPDAIFAEYRAGELLLRD